MAKAQIALNDAAVDAAALESLATAITQQASTLTASAKGAVTVVPNTGTVQTVVTPLAPGIGGPVVGPVRVGS